MNVSDHFLIHFQQTQFVKIDLYYYAKDGSKSDLKCT